MSYIKAQSVISPKKQWHLVDVFIDEGAGKPAYALGTWDDERRIGFRWNGTDDSPLGNPQSRGLPTWTMLDPELHAAVLAVTPREKQAIVSAYLGLPCSIELVVDYHPTGNRTLKERDLGKNMYHDLKPPFFANGDAAKFYRAVAAYINERQTQGQHVIYKDTSS